MTCEEVKQFLLKFNYLELKSQLIALLYLLFQKYFPITRTIFLSFSIIIIVIISLYNRNMWPYNFFFPLKFSEGGGLKPKFSSAEELNNTTIFFFMKEQYYLS